MGTPVASSGGPRRARIRDRHEVPAQREVLARRISNSDPNARDAHLRRDDGALDVVVEASCKVVEGQCAQATGQVERLGQFRGIDLRIGEVPAVGRHRSLAEPTHRGRAGQAHLLRGNHRVARHLPAHCNARLPVALDRLQVAAAHAQDGEVVPRLAVAGGQVRIRVGGPVDVRVLRAQGPVAGERNIEVDRRPRADLLPGVGQAERPRSKGDAACNRRRRRIGADRDAAGIAARVDVLVIEPGHQLARVFALPREVMVQAQAEHVTLAHDPEGPAERGRGTRRVHARIAVDDVDAVADPVKRDAVPHADDVDLHGPRAVRRCGVGQRQCLVLVKHVGVLVGHAYAQPAGGCRAGVVYGHVRAVQAFLGDFHLGVHLALFLADPERDLDLLGRVLIGQLDVGRHVAQVGYIAHPERWQSGEDVFRAEDAVAGNDHLPDRTLGHLQPDYARGQFLFRNIHLHGAVSATAIDGFESFQGFLDVAIHAAGPHLGRDDALHLFFSKQRIAFDLEPEDVEAFVLGDAGKRDEQGTSDSKSTNASRNFHKPPEPYCARPVPGRACY